MPPQPPSGELEAGIMARAALSLRRSIEKAAEDGDGEARDVLAHEARQVVARWGRRLPRKRKPPPPDHPGRITADVAARRLGISLRKLQQMAAAGALPGSAKIGRR